jgi:TRAP-type C4-dicarboxylate transport system permease small subunit
VFFSNLNLNILSSLVLLITTALFVYRSLPLVRSEGPEEQARAQKVLVGCIVAGVLMAVAKPVAFWVTGWNVTTMQAGLPTELISAVDNLLQLLMYLGVVVVIAGLIYGGIQLSHTNNKTTTTTTHKSSNTQLNPSRSA